MAGRGSFIESYPVFGFDLNDYDRLFSEKLRLLLKLRTDNPSPGQARCARRWTMSASGRVRADPPARLDRRGRHAAIGDPRGSWAYHWPWRSSAASRSGSRRWLISTVRRARRRGTFRRSCKWRSIRTASSPRRRSWQRTPIFRPMQRCSAASAASAAGAGDRPQYEAGRGKRGALLVGDPNEVAEKILFEHSLFRNDRFLMQIDMGSLPHAKTLKAIELFATKVAPQVRKALAPHGVEFFQAEPAPNLEPNQGRRSLQSAHFINPKLLAAQQQTIASAQRS